MQLDILIGILVAIILFGASFTCYLVDIKYLLKDIKEQLKAGGVDG